MKYHLIGIGGIGMSGIARLLLEKGDKVSGSDLRRSKITDQLEKERVQIVIGHRNDTVAIFSPDKVVYSAAISDYSPGYVEIEAAKKLNIPCLRRAVMINKLMKDKKGIAISGMHGKTTVASMIASIMIAAKLDPTVLVGGIINDLKSNAKLGKGKYFVIEACEYDNTFLEFEYDRAVVTNIEEEHLEYFGSLQNIIKTFKKFIAKIPSQGLLVACSDNDNVKKIIKSTKSKIITYGLKKENDVYADDIKIDDGIVSFKIISEKIEFKDNQFQLKIPGKHNVLNALAAIILTKDLEISEEIIRKSLTEFSGIKRRLEIYDEIGGVLVMDDYAHHPTEIRATLEALREFYKNRRVIVVFRPAQYSRNKALLEKYGGAFSDANLVIIPKTYEPAGRDREEKDIDSKRIVDEINKNHKEAIYLPGFENVIDYLKKETKSKDLIITMGLGPLYELTEEIIDMLKERKNV